MENRDDPSPCVDHSTGRSNLLVNRKLFFLKPGLRQGRLSTIRLNSSTQPDQKKQLPNQTTID